LIERLLRSVAVMDVPIENGDTTNFLQRLRSTDGDRDITEDAKSPSDLAGRVMSGGSNQYIDVVDRSVENGLHAGRAGSGGQTDNIKGIGADPGALSNVAATLFADGMHLRNVLRRVTAQQVVLFREFRCNGGQLFHHPAGHQQFADALLGF